MGAVLAGVRSTFVKVILAVLAVVAWDAEALVVVHLVQACALILTGSHGALVDVDLRGVCAVGRIASPV